MRSFLITIALGLITCVLWLMGGHLYDIIKPAIVVSPKKITISSGSWGKIHSFEIQNRTDRTIYSIWIKACESEPNKSDHRFKIIGDSKNSFHSYDLQKISINFDVVQFIAWDSKDRPCIYLLLYEIGPLDNRQFKIKSISPLEKYRADIFLEPIGHSNEPAPIAFQKDKLGLRFNLPENITLKGYSVMLKSKK